MGHQWFWSYELSDFITDNGTAIDFDSCLMFWENIYMGNKLSNSGEVLKLLIPNYILNSMSGWTNYSGKVTSQKMSENEMGNRGSKSETKMISVKEQRVDGSRYKRSNLKFNKSLYYTTTILSKSKNGVFKYNPMRLRCTLMNCESNYHVKIPSKQLNIKKISTLINKENLSNGTSILNPWFITGFSDAEGSFSITISPDIRSNLKWAVQAVFIINLHKKDNAILEAIKNTLARAV